jgi:hypothetical protein
MKCLVKGCGKCKGQEARMKEAEKSLLLLLESDSDLQDVRADWWAMPVGLGSAAICSLCLWLQTWGSSFSPFWQGGEAGGESVPGNSVILQLIG